MKVLLVCLFMLSSCACVTGIKPIFVSDVSDRGGKTTDESTACPDGYMFLRESAQCYRFFDQKLSCPMAKQACMNDGSELAWVPDSALLKWLKSKVVPKNAIAVWYDHFDKSNPTCEAIMFGKTAQKQATSCDTELPFICRRPTEKAKLCEGEFKRNMCFQLERKMATWDQANQACYDKNGTLAFLRKKAEVNFIAEFLKKENFPSDTAAWVGLNAVNSKNTWKWTNQAKLNFKSDAYQIVNKDNHFRPEDAEPYPEGKSAKCGSVINKGHSLKANKCDMQLPYVCTFAIPDDPYVKEAMNKEAEKQETLINNNKKSPCGKILMNNLGNPLAEDDHMWESDIRLTDQQAEVKRTGGNPLTARTGSHEGHSSQNGSSEAGSLRRKRSNVSPYESHLWPGGEVPYEFDPAFDAARRQQVRDAMDELESRTCLKFIPKTTAVPHFIYIRDDNGACYSYIGRVELYMQGRQDVSLGYGCMVRGIIQHELMHALGFWHEHSRVDRDEYVRILYENIQEGREGNFGKLNTMLASMNGIPYDYSSILHYTRNAFSISGLDTIVPINPTTAQIGMREEITEVDLAEINILYDCPIPVHGGWSEFGPWSDCDATCGGGKRERTRTCTYPPPRNNGNPCEGSAKETETCKPDPCPIETSYIWGGCWEDPITGPDLLTSLESESSTYLTGHWTERPDKIQACANEAKSKNLTTFALKYGGECYGVVDEDDDYDDIGPSDNCNIYGTGSGDALDVYHLGNIAHGMWGVWGPYGVCNKECGGGNQTRTRTCTNPKPSDGANDCVGDSSESIICNDKPCPIDGGWSKWEEWSDCVGPCGTTGQRSRSRKCNSPPPQYNGADCQGDDNEIETCYTAPCPTTTPAPTTTTTSEQLPFEVDIDVNGLIDGAIVKLPFEKPTSGTTDQNTILPTVEGRKGNGIVLENYGFLSRAPRLCIYDPDTCKNGFAVSLWLKQTQIQRFTEVASRPHTILTFGVEAEEAETPKQGLGLAVYFRRNGMLKVLLRTRTRHYTVDWPPFVFDEEKWHHVIVQWHPDKGLTLYYKGILVNTDKKGGEHNNPKIIIYDHFMLGRPLQCFDHFFEGYLDEIYMWERELSAAEAYGLFKNVPSRCEDCSKNTDCTNNICTCRQGFYGDGFYCQLNKYLDPADLTGGAPMYFWPMNKFTDMKVIGSGPLFRKDYMTVSLGIKDYAVVFNGRRDMLEAGDFSKNCFHNPDACPEGFTIAFWLKYLGRGGRKNYILSTGAQPDPVPRLATTGLALFVNRRTAHAYVKTSNRTYNTTFPIPRGTWSHVVFRWRKGNGVGNGLYVYVNEKERYYDSDGKESKPKQAETSRFTIGEPNNVRVYNGRFFLDNLAMWEKPLSEDDVAKLFKSTLPGQTPRSL